MFVTAFSLKPWKNRAVFLWNNLLSVRNMVSLFNADTPKEGFKMTISGEKKIKFRVNLMISKGNQYIPFMLCLFPIILYLTFSVQ